MRRQRTSLRLLLVFSLLLSLLLVVGSTYSWVTYSDERVNRVSSPKTQLHLRLVGEEAPVLTWSPGTTVPKGLAVKNEGDVPAFVRLSLYEAFLAFNVDVTEGTGNGNLAVVEQATKETIDARKPSTWAVGRTYSVGKSASGEKRYYTATTAIVNTPTEASTAYKYGEKRTGPLARVTFTFLEALYKTTLPAIDTPYWFYEDGYFYYSEILAPGDTTPALLTSLTLDACFDNRYKGALYALTPVMDGHDVTSSVVSDWGITGEEVAKLYDQKSVKGGP